MQQRVSKKKPLYNPYTFVFDDPKLQKEFNEYQQQKPVEPGTLKGQLIYNVLAMPAFIYWHYYYHVLLQRPCVVASYLVLFTVVLTHCSFFALYVLEPTMDDQKNKNEKVQKIHGERRMIAVNLNHISALCACGLVMHVSSQSIYTTSYPCCCIIPLILSLFPFPV